MFFIRNPQVKKLLVYEKFQGQKSGQIWAFCKYDDESVVSIKTPNL